MDATPFSVPIYFDYLATSLFAFSGALVAARRGFDLLGIAVIAVVSSTGGGVIRDGIFIQNGPPLLVRSSIYLAVIAVALAIALLLGHRLQKSRAISLVLMIVDSFALGMYGVVGCTLSLANGIGYLGSALVGVVNATGGGILRDALMSQEQDLFKPGTLKATAAVIGCITLVMLRGTEVVSTLKADWTAIILVFLLRAFSVIFGFQTTSFRRFVENDEEFERPASGKRHIGGR